jgi:O-antigen/teichoic acid export membrane protein
MWPLLPTRRIQRATEPLGAHREFLSASAANLILKLFSSLCGLLILAILSRILGINDLGIYAFAVALLTLVSIPCSAGLPQIVTREIARNASSKRYSLVKGVIHWGHIVILIVTIFVITVLAIYTYFYPQVLNHPTGRTFIAGIGIIPTIGLLAIRSASLRGLGHTTMAQLPDFVIRPVSALLLLLALYVWRGSSISPSHAILIETSAFLIGYCAATLLFSFVCSKEIRGSKTVLDSSSWQKMLLPMSIINAMHIANTKLDQVIVGFFLSSSDSGTYRVAAQISILAGFGLQATKRVIQPKIAAFVHEGRLEDLQQLARVATLVNIIFSMTFFVIIYFFGNTIIQILFGGEYEDSVTCLLILALGHVFMSSTNIGGQILAMAGFHKFFAYTWIGGTVINLTLSLFLVKTYGILGVAAATSGALVCVNVAGCYGAERLVGCRCLPRLTVKNRKVNRYSGDGRK